MTYKIDIPILLLGKSTFLSINLNEPKLTNQSRSESKRISALIALFSGLYEKFGLEVTKWMSGK